MTHRQVDHTQQAHGALDFSLSNPPVYRSAVDDDDQDIVDDSQHSHGAGVLASPAAMDQYSQFSVLDTSPVGPPPSISVPLSPAEDFTAGSAEATPSYVDQPSPYGQTAYPFIPFVDYVPFLLPFSPPVTAAYPLQHLETNTSTAAMPLDSFGGAVSPSSQLGESFAPDAGSYRPTVGSDAHARVSAERRVHPASFACPKPNCNKHFTRKKTLDGKCPFR
ncbi:hypothetical protein EV714DRAFT_266627 [Schizophyllum commune]